MTDLKYGVNVNPRFFVTENGEKTEIELNKSENGFSFIYNKLEGNLLYTEIDNGFCYDVNIYNNGETEFSSDALALDMGIDTYLDKYPDWNDKFFPTFFRTEKTHFYGYFMQPTGGVLGVFCKSPVASYSHSYNSANGYDFGHRINYTEIDLISSIEQPYHHPNNCKSLKAGEKRNYEIYFEKCETREIWRDTIVNKYHLPFITAEKFTVELNEKIVPQIFSSVEYSCEITSPNGEVLKDLTAKEYGLYNVTLKAENGFVATACFFCRKPFDWYLKAARSEAIAKSQHATTHCESWYGFFSGFLAEKHYPNEQEDKIINEMFDEIMPYMYDFENIKPIIIPNRIQNTSALISLLVDRYEVDPIKNAESLMLASKFGDWLMTNQRDTGGYYRDGILYTCVIYPAKSMLELALAERNAEDKYFKEAAERHYNSAKMAIDNLVEKLENIQTEGEHTLEDGMISCSSLQIAMFALTLPKEKRAEYTKAAEHMFKVHACLEQLENPDCRARGTTIRYWEAQYDIQFMSNLQTSPHGWSAWLLYALYYLYILTGKKEYLLQLMDGMGACVQLLSLDGKLRWAFAVDPWIVTDRAMVPDNENPVVNAYKSVKTKEQGFRGKFEKRVIGEQYLDMISGWYQTGEEQPANGGYHWCPLYLENETLNVDNQGGCCDNDVHEIFKCLEETVLKKAFIHQNSDGSLICYNCKAELSNGNVILTKTEEIDTICSCFNETTVLQYKDNSYNCESGINLITI